MKTYNRKIGQKAGHLRLYLEGQYLKDFGFSRGDRYTIKDNKLILDENGERIVSGYPNYRGFKDYPVIDLLNKKVKQLLGEDIKIGDDVFLKQIKNGVEIKRGKK